MVVHMGFFLPRGVTVEEPPPPPGGGVTVIEPPHPPPPPGGRGDLVKICVFHQNLKIRFLIQKIRF